MEACKNHNGEIFCVVCGETESVEVHDGLGVCTEHFSEVFSRCSKCGQYVDNEHVELWTSDTSHHSTQKKVLCKTCANEERTTHPQTRWLQTDWAAMESSHAVGVEMECINKSNMTIEEIYRKYPKQMAFWSQHYDSSVTGGLELVSSPIMMKRFKKFMTSCAWMEKIFKVDNTCGLHVHFNMRPWINFETADIEELGTILQKLHYGFMKLEKYMFSAQPSSRNPGGERYSFTKKTNDVFHTLTESRVRHMKPTEFVKKYYENSGYTIIDTCDIPKEKMGIRYCWLNLSVISLHDTIEFRLHSGSTSAKKIMIWVSILDKLMTHILDSTMEQLDTFSPQKLRDILTIEEMDYLNHRIEKFRRE